MHARMAVTLLEAHDVSDLCIGKPALRWLPPSSAVADAIAELELGRDAVAVWDGDSGQPVAGRVCMADVLLFLCDGGAAALQATLSDLLLASGSGAPRVSRIEPDASVLEAVDALLDGGAHSLVVPIRERRRADRELRLCWLTVEDLVRFFLGIIALFSPTASLSVSDLGIVRPATLAVAAGDSALSAVPLLRDALTTHASVAVISPDIFPRRRIVGEISPLTLSSCDALVIAALSARELAVFVDWPDATIHAAVQARLRLRNLLLLDPSSSSSCSSSSASSSSFSTPSSSEDDDDDGEKGKSDHTRQQPLRLLHAARRRTIMTGRRRAAEEGIVACQRGSSLVAVMVQAITHRVTQVWVVNEENELVGVVGFLDVLRVLRRHLLQHYPPISI